MQSQQTNGWAREVLEGRPPLMTRNETAEVCRLSLRTVSRLIAAGQLAAVKVGQRVLVPRQAVAKFLETRGAP